MRGKIWLFNFYALLKMYIFVVLGFFSCLVVHSTNPPPPPILPLHPPPPFLWGETILSVPNFEKGGDPKKMSAWGI